MTAIAVENAVGLEPRRLAVLGQPVAPWAGARFIDEREPAANGDIKPWELHSELVLVCPEVRERAREFLPERDPDAFLARPREPVFLAAGTIAEAQHTTSLPVAVARYAVWRLIGTARIALFILGGVVALALLAEALH
jgi:hypothetical protein